MALGLVLATRLWRGGWLGAARWFILALAPIPAYVYALTWTTLAGAAGRLLRPLGVRAVPFDGPLAATWVMTLWLLPLALALAMLATESVPRRQVAAARPFRPDLEVLRRIVLPLAGPLLWMGLALLFLLSVLDYSVPSLYQMNVYALEVFVTFSRRNDPAQAFLSAVPLVLVTGLVVLAVARGLRRAAQPVVHEAPFGAAPPAWPRWYRAVQGLALAVLTLQVVAPLATLLVLAGSPAAVLSGLGAIRGEIAFSLAVAAVTALVALPMCLAVAHALERPGRVGALAWLAVCLPLAIPPSLVGIGLVTVFNQRYLPLHGTAVMPVVAGMARFAPVMTLVLYAQLRRLDGRLLDAAQVFAPGPVISLLRVKLPLMLPGLVGAACIGFALTVGELGATLIVAPAGRGTLTMRAFNYLHYGASEGVAALCLFLVLVAMAAGLAAAAAMGRMGGARPTAGGSS